jgi:hypothetical protein
MVDEVPRRTEIKMVPVCIPAIESTIVYKLPENQK